MSNYSFAYNRKYDPPAPIIEIRLRSLYGISNLLQAFVDSGADGTVVPLTILQSINAVYADKAYLTGSTGAPQRVGLYEVQVQIGADIVYGINAAAYGEEIIVGRDVLNQLTVLLDGPLATCEITV
jgi:predicted aspartyl protease